MRNHAKMTFPVKQCSTDGVGGLGEDIPPFAVAFCEFEECKTSTLCANTQEQTNWTVHVGIQQNLINPHHHLG